MTTPSGALRVSAHTLVVDASVAVKWFVRDEREDDVPKALEVLREVAEGARNALQPPHWMAEVLATLSRVAPDSASAAVDLLSAMELPVCCERSHYQRACALSSALEHHLFDTLYHALALETEGASFVTADARYFRKAKHLGSIKLLPDMPVT